MSKFFKIATVVASKTSGSGWLNATVHLVDEATNKEDGKKISFPPTLTEFGVTTGLYVNLVPSKSEYNDYLVIGMQRGSDKRGDTEKKQGYGGGGQKTAPKSVEGGGRESYWQDKAVQDEKRSVRLNAQGAAALLQPFYVELFKQNPTAENLAVCLNQMLLHAKHIDRALSGDMNTPSVQSTPAAPPPVQDPPVQPTPVASPAPWGPDVPMPTDAPPQITSDDDLPF